MLLRIIGLVWAALGVGNIFLSTLLAGDSGTILSDLFVFNFLLFILPGLFVYVIGSLISGKAAKKVPKTDMETGQCPFCAETIKKDAAFCQYCRRDLPKPVPMKSGMIPAKEYAAVTNETEKVIITDIIDGRLNGRFVDGSWMVKLD